MTGFRSRRFNSAAGFTLLELLVSLGLVSVLMTMAVGHVMQMHQGYFTDVVRTRINSNLRSAMDIVSMNIRQAGENLPGTFPAVLLTDGTAGASDALTLRRSIVPEVLTLCNAISAGATSLQVSSATLVNAECIAANVASAYDAFEERRTDNNNSIRIFLYNWTAETGEFVDYTAGTDAGGQYVITVSGVAAAYPVLTTSIYLLEEYRFNLDVANETLDVYVDGYSAAPKTVAFSVTGLDFILEMADGTSLTELTTSSTLDWKDISQVSVSLTGQETYKGKAYTSGITSKYFPRNVLSYES